MPACRAHLRRRIPLVNLDELAAGEGRLVLQHGRELAQPGVVDAARCGRMVRAGLLNLRQPEAGRLADLLRPPDRPARPSRVGPAMPQATRTIGSWPLVVDFADQPLDCSLRLILWRPGRAAARNARSWPLRWSCWPLVWLSLQTFPNVSCWSQLPPLMVSIPVTSQCLPCFWQLVGWLSGKWRWCSGCLSSSLRLVPSLVTLGMCMLVAGTVLERLVGREPSVPYAGLCGHPPLPGAAGDGGRHHLLLR